MKKELTTHEVVQFNVFKGGHNSVVLKSWAVADEDGLDREKTFISKVKSAEI